MLTSVYRSALFCFAACALVASVMTLSMLETSLWSIVFMPWAYLAFLWLTARASWDHGPTPFLLICQITAFLRYVGFPIFLVLGGGYEGRSWIEPRPESYDMAAFVMALEALVVGLVIHVLERRYHQRRLVAPDRPVGVVPHWYFGLLVLLVAALVAIEPFSLMYVNIGVPRIISDEEDVAAIASLASMTLIALKVFLFLRIIHSVRNSRMAPWLAILLVGGAALFNAVVYFGTNRMAVLLTAFTSFYMIYKMFGRKVIAPIAVCACVVAALFLTITKERQYVDVYGDRILNAADQIQSYVGGNYNVAIGLEVPEFYPEASDPVVFAFDILRPTVGFNLLVQDWDVFYSNIYFNLRLFTHVDRRSQIMPMVAQGALFLPLAFAPLLSALVVGAAYWLLNAASQTDSLEVRYAFLIMAMRIGFFWGQNTMNMMNYLSLNVIIPLAMLSGYYVLKKMMPPGQSGYSNI